MSKLLAHLFTPTVSSADGLSQSQREAIVDLLHFCMCADDKLRAIEDRVISNEVARFGWDGPVPFGAFAQDSLERATAALTRYATRSAFIADVAERLGNARTKARAMLVCQQLLLADREYPDAEQVVFREIRDVFAASSSGRN